MLSPVIITGSILILRSCSTAFLLPGFITSATAMIPSSSPSTAINIAVLPSADNLPESSRAFISMFLSFISLLFPRRTSFPCIRDIIPCPGIASKLSASYNFNFISDALPTIASPRGCSEPFSAEAANCSNLVSSRRPVGIISVITGFPSVIVPVLSNTTVFI